MKAYRSEHGHMNLFRPELNMQRLNKSAKRVGLPGVDTDVLLKGIERLVSIDNEWLPASAPLSLYIRPNLIGTEVSTWLIRNIKSFLTKANQVYLNIFSLADLIGNYLLPLPLHVLLQW